MRPAALLAAAFLAACGQTGALYLPDEGVETPVEIRGPVTRAPTPAADAPPPDDEEKEEKPAPPTGS